MDAFILLLLSISFATLYGTVHAYCQMKKAIYHNEHYEWKKPFFIMGFISLSSGTSAIYLVNSFI